jgi:hypothetical protein
MSAPFQLDAGIFLEDEHLLIPWLTPRESLKKIGAPELHSSLDFLSLSWRERLVLGGLRCTFHTRQRGLGKPAKGVSQAESLIFAGFDRLPAPYGGLASVDEEYHDTRRHLSMHLGTPSRTWKGKWSSLHSEWVFPGFFVRLYTDDREGCALTIFHESASKVMPDKALLAAYAFDMFGSTSENQKTKL